MLLKSASRSREAAHGGIGGETMRRVPLTFDMKQKGYRFRLIPLNVWRGNSQFRVVLRVFNEGSEKLNVAHPSPLSTLVFGIG